MIKFVYAFTEGNGQMKNLLGGKGANLAEMTNLGIPVPPGFTLTTEACNQYYSDSGKLNTEITQQVEEKLQELEKTSGKYFGDLNNPLLVSVRSGARESMPGMMDTVLNLGLNDEVVEAFAKATNNERFVYDSNRRFIQMYSDVVKGLNKSKFEEIIDEMKYERNIELDSEFTAEDFKEMIKKFKNFYYKSLAEDFPNDPKEQLMNAIEAVFKSWENPRAVYYRRMNDIPAKWGTAVNVQTMVFGNRGDDCATGVAFTRNPATGKKHIFGEFLFNAQGEDVVAGVRTPYDILVLKEKMPECYAEFESICTKLENHFKDMQDLEFTIENSKLYLLQTRNGKRTATAALNIAVDLTKEGLLSKEEALMKINPKQLDTLLHPQFDTAILKETKALAKGLPASPGAASGKVVFTAEKAVKEVNKGNKVVLVRLETSPEDIEGMHLAEGILTSRGGMTSHAAVVARGMGTCCVAGCGELKFVDNYCLVNGVKFAEEDYISLDGSTGNIYQGLLKTVPANISGSFATIMQWSDEIRDLTIRTNADTPQDAKKAREFGAEGIGLVRTEHMFFDSERIKAMREMIIAKAPESREKALAKLLPMQRGDFEAIYEVMKDLPVTIRYLDPPLHEFLPKSSYDIKALADDLGISVNELKDTIASLHEFNPMMGHRGCRLAVTYPEIAKMQTRAVIEAAINVMKKEPNLKITPEIMIPLVGESREFKFIKDIVVSIADEIIEKAGIKVDYLVGTMIEVPRAALTADEIAKDAEFFSFGTNDLTQMTFGFSRDDAGSFLNDYYDNNIYENDPFARVDEFGVGKLVKMACNLAKTERANIKLGVCGEHGGDPFSIDFFHRAGLNYVSCSPFRVPIARLAAAQAKIRNK
ncbi:MAG: pyruvate, phosphate dikinase [Erysipelotrichaceae bacterium]